MSGPRLAQTVGAVPAVVELGFIGWLDLFEKLVELGNADAGEGSEMTRFASQLGYCNHETQCTTITHTVLNG